MRKFLAVPFEALQVLGMAFFFAIALLLTYLTAPDWLAKVAPKMSHESAGEHFRDVAGLIGRNGLWIAAAALLGGIIAPYARADGKKTLAWIRVTCAAASIVIVFLVWGTSGAAPKALDGDAEGGRRASDTLAWRSDKKPTPWNGLLLATGLNLFLGAFQITGGAGKKPKPKGGGDDK
jgi:hypothetical protein